MCPLYEQPACKILTDFGNFNKGRSLAEAALQYKHFIDK